MTTSTLTSNTIHASVDQKMEWLMSQQFPAKAVAGFIIDCMGWQQRFGLPANAAARAMRLVAQLESGQIDRSILKEFAAPVITQLAYIREGARERQLESPDEPVRLTQEWWLERAPGWAFV